MARDLSQSIEDYLKAIYELTLNEGRASTNELAEYLEVTPASVTGMVKKLSGTQPPLVEYQKHHGVVLTGAGQKVALEIIRHHRLLELFLHQMLGFPWDEVHAEADRLEHVISERFEERMAVALGDPRLDPHGDPIPRRDLSLPSTAKTHLADLRPGQSGTIVRVRDNDAELLRYLSEQGVVPNAKVHVLDYSEFDGNLRIKVGGKVGSSKEPVVLGPRITDQIFIKRE